jgi:hypothetical protein
MKWQVCFLVFILFFSFSLAEEVLDDREASRQCLLVSSDYMDSLEDQGFNVLRINDSLQEAKSIYESQILVEQRGAEGVYGFVLDSCDEIENLYEMAIESRDDQRVLLNFYSENIVPEMNTEKLDNLIDEIDQEINNERYEKVSPLIEDAYEEVSIVQEEYTRLNRFYSSTSRGFVKIFRNYGIYLGIVLGFLLLVYLIYRARIKRVLIKRKLRLLRMRKESVRKLIEKMQRDYFERGSVSEGDYQVRSDNFASIIRDMDRQIPVLEEMLIKYKGNKSDDEKKEKDKRIWH